MQTMTKWQLSFVASLDLILNQPPSIVFKLDASCVSAATVFPRLPPDDQLVTGVGTSPQNGGAAFFFLFEICPVEMSM